MLVINLLTSPKYPLAEHSYFTRSKVKGISTDSSLLTWTTKRACSKMDPTIHTVASSEMIPTPSIAAYPSASVAAESPMEVIASLERQIGALNLLVAQYQTASLNQPSDARERGPMPPVYPTSSEFHQGDHFATFQQTQSASPTNST